MNANIHNLAIWPPEHNVPKFAGFRLIKKRSNHATVIDDSKCWFRELHFYSARLELPITTRWMFEHNLQRILDGIGI